jgi:hypothetical protein
LQWATLVVALGPADENGFAHLGLSARSAETGERRSWSLAASPANSGDPVVRDRGEKVREYHDVVLSRFGGGGGFGKGRGSPEGFAIAAAD